MIDVNDNAPEIEVTSFSSTVPEDARIGTTVALISVSDLDSGVNGKVICSITEDVPFTLSASLQDNMYALVTKTKLDREQSPYNFYITENNAAGGSVFSVKASDRDEGDNALISYQILRDGGERKGVEEVPRNVYAGHLVTKVRAYDADIGYNGWLLFSLQECSKTTDVSSKYLPETNYDGTLCHSIQYRSGEKRYMLVGPRMSIGSTIVPGSNGNTLVVPDRRSTSTEIRYAIAEEVKEGTVVGHIAKDLGLDKSTLRNRGYRIVQGSTEPLFQVNQVDGILYVNRKIDREEVCERSKACVIELKTALENPLENNMFSVVTKSPLDREKQSQYDVTIIAKDAGEPSLSSEKTIRIDISDVNDNSPQFLLSPYTFYLTENNSPGASVFKVQATDQDEGNNAHISYHIFRGGDNLLSSFLNINPVNGDISALKSFDFEKLKMFRFHVVATDSGSRSLSSNVSVKVFLLDQNDNNPVILHPVSSNGSTDGVEEVPRNVPAGHLVTKVRAWDADIGYNGWLLFSLQEVSDHSLFGLDRYTGRIRTLRSFTETDEAQHKLVILVKDNGNVSLSATATVVVKLVEPKEAISASDVKSAATDIGDSGVTFYLMITLASVSTLFLISIIVLIAMQCSKTTDVSSKYLPETNYDGTLCHSIQYRSGEKRYMLVGPRMSIGSTIVPGSNGNTLVVPDRRSTSTEIRYSIAEEVKEGTVVGHIAKDLGLDKSTLRDRGYRIVHGSTEPLFQVNQDDGILYVNRKIDREEVCERSKACVIELKTVLENPLENDNPPVILHPVSSNGSAEGVEEVPRNVPAGHLVTKVRAYDADIGYNGWLLFSLQEVSDHSLFGLDRYTGRIRTLRSITETDEAQHKLVILVKDNGNVSLSATATVVVKLVEPKEAISASDVKSAATDIGDSGVKFYLMITLASVSTLFLISIIVLIAMQCSKTTDVASKYLPETNYDGTLCHSIQYRSGEKRYMLVGPRMSIGSTIVPGSNGNTLVVPDRRSTSAENDNPPVILHPVSSNGSAEGVEEVPRNVPAGYLVTKVRAYDADIGYNGWLLFSLQEVSDHSLFGLDRYTGRIRTLRSFTETDETQHKLVILVKDNGNVSLSATATVVVKLVEPKEAISASDVKSAATDIGDSGVTFYLMITLASVSTLFLISIIVLIAMQCSKTMDVSSKYLPETNYDGTLCHSIQYRSGEKRYMLVGPRMSIGSTIVPGSNGNTLVVPDRRSTSVEIRYSIAEEVKEGTVVGHIAKDLGLDKSTLRNRGYRIVHGSTEPLFQVNQDDGILYVNRKIDREEVGLCERSKACVIDLKTALENPLEVHYVAVEVLDVNDHAPSFLEKEKMLEIFESALPGARFQIQVTKTPLDREKQSQYDVTIIAKDTGEPSLSSEKTIRIDISDVNDNSPQFILSPFTFYLTENNSPGDSIFKVQATDQDEGDNAVISYHIFRGRDNLLSSFLNINPINGDISALKSFDFEKLKTFRFHVVATDSGSPSLSSNVSVNVFLLDQNDNPPVILHPVSSNGSAEGAEEVPRNVPAGHLVTKVRAWDADIGYNGWLLFSLQEVSDHSLFGLDRYTGRIRTLHSFTETDEAQHKLVILVKDNGNVSLSATATVVVKLVEPKEAISASDVKSAATDIGDSGVTFYLMITLASVSTLFLISIIVLIAMQCSKTTDVSSKYLPETNYDGTLCHSIQYRSGEKRYMLVGPRMSIGSTIVPGSNGNTLVVPDRRSTSAEIRYSIAEEVQEGTVVGHIAKDLGLDKRTLRNRGYRIVHGSTEPLFQVNQDDGILFHVVATDSGSPSLSSNVSVNVFLLDENDNPPVILHPVSSNGSAEGVQEVPRNVPAGHLVTKVRAYDADIGYNGWLLFSLQEVSDHSLFGLDRYTGRIRTLRSFTETDEAQHKLIVLVKDNGNVSLSATATVVVMLVEPKEAISASDMKSAVTDIGDSGVTFYLMITLASVSTLFLISIIVLIAMQCSKTTDVSSKYLPETNYDGTLCHSIQYRSGEKRYMLVGPRMSIGSTIVPGSNGNTLVVPDRRSTSAEIRYSIAEEVKEGTVVGHIAKDLGLDKSTLRNRGYRIVHGSTEPLFQVNQDDGILYVNRKIDREENNMFSIVTKTPLDREKHSQYDVTIIAKDADSGSPSLSSNVSVNVFLLDQNDNPPVILHPVSSNGSAEGVEEVPRNVPAGHLVTKVRAYDADIGYNGWLLFSLQELSDHSLFGLDRYTGRIRTQRSFTETDEAQHKLVILVKDNGNVSLSATATVVVKLVEPKEAISASDVKSAATDIGDSGVTFYLMITLASVSTLFLISIIVLIAMQCSKTTDEEYIYRAQIRYSVFEEMDEGTVVGNIAKDLGLDKSEIRVVGLIDFEKSMSYEIDIQASDKGPVPLSADKSVIISIIDVNDNAPEIEVTSFSSTVPEDARIGTTVALISVSDLDSGVNGKVICSITEDVPFTLSASLQDNIYALVTKNKLDREQRSRYHVTVVARDTGVPPLSSEKTISVLVSDVNDNHPEFSLSPYNFYITENNAAGGSVFSVKASDRDEGDNALISYQILRDGGERSKIASFLNIIPESGDILALKSLDFETLKTFNLKVVATDSGSPSLSRNVSINVFVLDQNDNTPVILYPVNANGSAEGVEEVPRNVHAGHLVTKVRAYDADIGYNGWLLFSLQEVSDHSLFGLDRYTGRIRTLRSFTETDETQHKLVILVKDNGNVSLSATATVVVKLVEPKEAISASDVKSAATDIGDSGVTFYLMITLASVSTLFLISIIVLIAMQCSKTMDVSSKYLPETNYDGTLCHSIQYRSGEKRYMLVGPRMSIGSTIVPGSNGNTLVVPDRRSTSVEIRYSIAEEVKEGTVVGHIAKDLGLDKSTLRNRGYRIVHGSTEPLFQVNQDDGILYVNRKIDREENNMFSIVTKTPLDREKQSQYDVTIIAKDTGEPSLSSEKTIRIDISDVNDNSPQFILSPFTFYLTENNSPGDSIFKVQATDQDEGDNAVISYHIFRGRDNLLSSFLNINPINGDISALKSFDFEKLKTFRFHVVATDSGSPSLSSNVSVNVFLLDQNDNPPVILHPVSSNGSAEGAEEVPRNVPAGHLVTKVRAWDADIGYNGWLLFSLQEVSDHSLFGLDRYTGRIRTLRSFTETDEAQHKLVILVKDNGNVSLSATATVVVKLVEPKEAISASDVKSAATDIGDSGVTFYLMITLASVSTLFLISIIVLIAMQCSKTTDVSSKYLPETNYDGTLCHSIQYRSGEKRYMLVGPRMSIGSTIVPGSNGNTLVVPDRRSTSAEIRYSIAEEVQEGTVVGHIAKDLGLDKGTLRNRGYRIVHGSTEPLFQNDNPPVILHPVSSNGSAEGVEEVPRNVPAGHLVTKVRAYDADIGYNGWLLFSLQECSKTTDVSSKYLPETNYDGTLCHSIQYRSGEKRYMLVGPRMSIGSTIVPGSNGNTLVVPDRRSTSVEIDREEVCERTSACLINLKTVLENPLEVHYVGVEVLDMNDHSPSFPEKEKTLEISESVLPGARFQLQASRDPDG
ncbi:unnamed protein product, partial [Arctogadus glacialis]